MLVNENAQFNRLLMVEASFVDKPTSLTERCKRPKLGDQVGVQIDGQCGVMAFFAYFVVIDSMTGTDMQDFNVCVNSTFEFRNPVIQPKRAATLVVVIA